MAREEERSCVSESVHLGKKGCDRGGFCFINRMDRADTMIDILHSLGSISWV